MTLPVRIVTEAYIVKELPGEERNGRPCVQLLADVIYGVGGKDSEEQFVVPEGYVTDFASIPRAAWTLIGPPLGRHARAAILHDWLYDTNGAWGRFDRETSDRIFLEAMKVLGVNWVKRSLMFRAVRLGGAGGWQGEAARPLVRRVAVSGPKSAQGSLPAPLAERS